MMTERDRKNRLKGNAVQMAIAAFCSRLSEAHLKWDKKSQNSIIVISEFLERHSKAKRTRAPDYSQALRRINGVFQRVSSDPISKGSEGTWYLIGLGI